MKVMPFMKWLMVIFVVVAAIRAANGAGLLSLTDVLVELQDFEFGFEEMEEFFALFNEGKLLDSFIPWNFNLTGLSGLATNIGNVVGSFFRMLGTFLVTAFRALFFGLIDVLRLLVQIFEIVANILGFDFSLPEGNVGGAHRGGR